MKNLLNCTLTLFIAVNCFKSVCQTTLDKIININGTSRSYRIYIPQMYTGNEAVPLIFNFHGYTSTNLEQEFYGDFRGIADTANFILIHPQGLNGGSGTFWNTFSTVVPSNYDYQFVSQLIDTLVSNYTIDTNRIYSTGMSNGGFMSYDLACFMSHRFAAIASVTGSMISQHLSLCNPARKVPVLQIHGTNDATVSYSGTGGILTSTGIDDLVQFWVNHNQCETLPTITNVVDANSTDLSTVTHYVYDNLIENTSVELFKVQNGGHTWPGSIYNIPGLVTNQDFSASKEIWRFFSSHSMIEENPVTSSLVEKEISFEIYPNPVNSVLKINLNNLKEVKISIVSSLGIVLKTVQNNKENSIEISTQDLAEGIYFVEIGAKQERIIVLKD